MRKPNCSNRVEVVRQNDRKGPFFILLNGQVLGMVESLQEDILDRLPNRVTLVLGGEVIRRDLDTDEFTVFMQEKFGRVGEDMT